jgi:AcrR family transcriptional regulator
MAGAVKPDGSERRGYDNSRRQAQARATRSRVIAAARDLFVERGYPATSIEAVAEAADVAPATVYRLFGSKRELLKAIIDVGSGGDDRPIPFNERPEVVALLNEPDPIRCVEGFARLASEMGQRLDPIYEVVEAAAAVDSDSAELLSLMREQRFVGQGRIARALADRKALRKGMSLSQAHDAIYALFSPELRRVLLADRGWSPSAYAKWLTNMAVAAVLESGDASVNGSAQLTRARSPAGRPPGAPANRRC